MNALDKALASLELDDVVAPAEAQSSADADLDALEAILSADVSDSDVATAVAGLLVKVIQAVTETLSEACNLMLYPTHWSLTWMTWRLCLALMLLLFRRHDRRGRSRAGHEVETREELYAETVLTLPAQLTLLSRLRLLRPKREKPAR